MILYIAYGLVIIGILQLLLNIGYILLNKQIKNKAFTVAFPITNASNVVSLIIVWFAPEYGQTRIFRAAIAFAAFTTLLFVCLLSIETFSIFRVLNPNISNSFLHVTRITLISTYSFFAISGAYYYITGTQQLLMRIGRLCFVANMSTLLVSLIVYWIYLVRTTLKREPSERVKLLLNRTLYCVTGIVFFISMGTVTFIIYDYAPIDDVYKAASLMCAIYTSSSGLLLKLILFVSVVEIEMNDRRKAAFGKVLDHAVVSTTRQVMTMTTLLKA
jgi:hypothetical protein